jgi:hypothetical protein
LLTWLAACGGENTPATAGSPGTQESTKTKALEAGADLLQSKAPLRALNAYLDGFHFYSGDPQAQVEAHHYCGHLSEDLIQCVIFDGNEEDARIMGIEYIVSRVLFEKLPTEERHLWHSHVHEVRSGTLIAPGIPDPAERELMEKLAGMYGKTWHTWHASGTGAHGATGDGSGGAAAGAQQPSDAASDLPIGTPMLMMGFTDAHPADPKLVEARDRRAKVSSPEKRGQRADIQYPPIHPDADAWQKGIVPQLRLTMVEQSR